MDSQDRNERDHKLVDFVTEYTDEQRIDHSRARLREHINFDSYKKGDPSEDKVLFFIELSPYSSHRGSACRLPTCDGRIKERSYRFAIYPGMLGYWKNADFYHLHCFEQLADFSQAAYLDRVAPVTRNSASLRNLTPASILDCNHFVDGGAERLILEWKVSMGRLMDLRDGIEAEATDPDFNDLLRKAGSASYKPKRVEGISDHEFYNLSRTVAPIESEGVDDQEEWNLFEQYLTMSFDEVEDLDEPHSLSDMLHRWYFHKIIACTDDESLTDKAKEEKKKLCAKSIKAIQRLSSIPGPNFQSALLS